MVFRTEGLFEVAILDLSGFFTTTTEFFSDPLIDIAIRPPV